VGRLLLALAIGLLLGFERERHEWSEERSGPVGTRTFGVIALLGALTASHSVAAVAVAGTFTGAMVWLAYQRRPDDNVGLTTEFATVIAFFLGVLCVTEPRDAAALGVATVVILESKQRVRNLVRGVISNEEFEDALRYAVFAAIILPLLPNRAFDDYGVVNPYAIWLKVLLLAGIGFVGYLAARALGPSRGIATTGIAGGFVSATATTAAMAARARHDREQSRAAASGALWASVITCVQLVIVTTAVAPGVGRRIAVPSAAGAAVLVIGALSIAHRTSGADRPTGHVGRPLDMKSSLVVAAILTAALWTSRFALRRYGAAGILVTSATTGLADAHAAALVCAQLVATGDVSVTDGMHAIGAGLAANTVVKVVVAFTGGRRFAVLFTAMIALAAAAMVVGFVLA
jgi:uncharacterized membrane protein (DUF4010 family)